VVVHEGDVELVNEEEEMVVLEEEAEENLPAQRRQTPSAGQNAAH